jgi:hypothetical protein
VKRFRRTRVEIENCLRVGVVPHSATAGPPDPVSIINSAFCFYLTSLPGIIGQFERAGAENEVDVYAKWTKRLEMWTMKAIEDARIQDRLRGLRGRALWSSLEKKS